MSGIGVAAIAVTLATAGFAARQFYIDPELQVLRDLKAKNPTDPDSLDRLRALPMLEEDQRRYEQGIIEYENMTDAQKKAVGEESVRRYEENMAKIRQDEKEEEEYKDKVRKGLLPPRPLPNPMQAGIRDGSEIEPSGDKFTVINYWTAGDFFNKQAAKFDRIFFVAGASLANPQQGIVRVDDFSLTPPLRYYPSPTATGPLKVIAENNGILTLTSMKGIYNAYDFAMDVSSKVSTPGGATYYFDTNARAFVTPKK